MFAPTDDLNFTDKTTSTIPLQKNDNRKSLSTRSHDASLRVKYLCVEHAEWEGHPVNMMVWLEVCKAVDFSSCTLN